MVSRLTLAIALTYGVSVQVAVAQPAQGGGEVAVVDFYAPSPLTTVEGLIPETFVADDLTRLLAQPPGGRVRVLSRAAVQQAESALRWQAVDALRFARLQELAAALKVNRLVIGWIQQLDLDRGAQNGAGGVIAFAAVTVQVFDATRGRITSQVRESGSEFGVIRTQVAERLLHNILEHTLPSVLPALSGTGP